MGREGSSATPLELQELHCGLAGIFSRHADGLGVPGHEHSMPAGQGTIAHAFQQHGFRTAYFGEGHVNGFKEASGRGRPRASPVRVQVAE